MRMYESGSESRQKKWQIKVLVRGIVKKKVGGNNWQYALKRVDAPQQKLAFMFEIMKFKKNKISI